MIKIRKSANVPSVLIDEGVPLTRQNCQAFDQNPAEYTSAPGINSRSLKKMDIKNEVYGHQTVKTRLINDQYEKCCFCEAKFVANGYGDVEHFRPKKAYRRKGDRRLTYPGYYWLGYEGSNLLFSCQICNQKYKRNDFPLRDEVTRVQNHNDDHLLHNEDRLLVNPVSDDDPEQFIQFREEVPYAVNGDLRGKESIRIFGLDRKELNDIRLEYLKLVKIALVIANVDLNNINEVDFACQFFQITRNELVQRVTDAVESRNRVAKDSSKFAGMIRSNFPHLSR